MPARSIIYGAAKLAASAEMSSYKEKEENASKKKKGRAIAMHVLLRDLAHLELLLRDDSQCTECPAKKGRTTKKKKKREGRKREKNGSHGRWSLLQNVAGYDLIREGRKGGGGEKKREKKGECAH